MNVNDLLLFILRDALWSGIAALGFAVLFNVPLRTLAGCALCGAAGHTARTLLLEPGFLTIEAATLVGAIVVGFIGVVLARVQRVPMPIFTVSGVIPMVPGVFAFQAMIGVIQVASLGPDASATLLVEATTNAIKTTLILGAIAVGIAAPTLLFQRRKPVV